MHETDMFYIGYTRTFSPLASFGFEKLGASSKFQKASVTAKCAPLLRHTTNDPFDGYD